MPEGERRLAAIMFTDMVGYTALGQRNESLSLALVEEQRKIIRPVLARHNGREVKTIGDAFLVEFPNALDAVRCAYDIQRAIREFNISLPDEKRIHLRAGLHLGDVVESHGDVSGDAVNVASRIEPLAEDGGVCLSRQIYESTHNKFEAHSVSIGVKTLKNVAEPMEVYRMVMPWEKETTTTRVQLDKNRIAVLPFANISPDPNDEYFADGMTEETISTISRIAGLKTISRTSVFQYKKTPKPMTEIGRELGVGTIVEGSVRKSGNRVRIAVQLIDVQSDEHVWAETYDRSLEDVFAIQSEIAERVANSLKVRILKSERERLGNVSTVSSEAYILYLKGRHYWTERTSQGLTKAIEYFKAAIDKDPAFALAFSGLADSYIASDMYGHLHAAETKGNSKANALKALRIDESLAEAHNSLACSLSLWTNDFSEGDREFRRAVELNPNYVTAHHWYAQLLARFGRFDEAMAEAGKARDLDPLSPTTYVTSAMISLFRGMPGQAVVACESVLEMNPDYLPASLMSGIGNVQDGRFQEGIRRIQPALGHLPVAGMALCYAYSRAGMNREALQHLAGLLPEARDQYDMAGVASIYSHLGMASESSRWLEKALQQQNRIEPDFRYRFYPWFSVLKSDRRFSTALE